MKWSVRKRDGAWLALDGSGVIRYASSDWVGVLTFALLGAPGRGSGGHVFLMLDEIPVALREALREAIRKRRERGDGGENGV